MFGVGRVFKGITEIVTNGNRAESWHDSSILLQWGKVSEVATVTELLLRHSAMAITNGKRIQQNEQRYQSKSIVIFFREERAEREMIKWRTLAIMYVSSE